MHRLLRAPVLLRRLRPVQAPETGPVLMATKGGSCVKPFLFWSCGCACSLGGLALARRLLRGPAQSVRPHATSPLPSAPLSARKLDSAKRAMSSVRLGSTCPSMDRAWAAGQGLLGESAGRGHSSRNSCTSSIASPAATRRSSTTKAQAAPVCCNLPPVTTRADSTRPAHGPISVTGSSSGGDHRGRPGRYRHQAGPNDTYGIYWPD